MRNETTARLNENPIKGFVDRTSLLSGPGHTKRETPGGRELPRSNIAMHCIGTRSGRYVRCHGRPCHRMRYRNGARRTDPQSGPKGHTGIILTIFYNKTQNIFTFHGHTNRISTPGVGRTDVSATPAVQVVGCKIVALFVIALRLSGRAYNIHIQTFRVITYGPVRAGISATPAVFHIGQIAAEPVTENLSLQATLSVDAGLS
jgi:hypothetical protein